jgi:hypothetical protein
LPSVGISEARKRLDLNALDVSDLRAQDQSARHHIMVMFSACGNTCKLSEVCKCQAGNSTQFGWRMLNRLTRFLLVEESDRRFKNFVFAGGDAGDGGLGADVGLDADALELAAVRVADVHAAETNHYSARH